MSTHDNKYSVNSRLNAHDAQLLALDKAIKSVILSPGPQGKQGQTGASGADGKDGRPGRDGKDGAPSTIPGPPGRAGHSIRSEKGARGERGEKGDSIVGPKGDSIVGPKGDKGERGDITIVGDAELAAAVAQLRAEKARAQAAFLVVLEENSKRPHSGLKKVLAATLEGLKRDAGL